MALVGTLILYWLFFNLFYSDFWRVLYDSLVISNVGCREREREVMVCICIWY